MMAKRSVSEELMESGDDLIVLMSIDDILNLDPAIRSLL